MIYFGELGHFLGKVVKNPPVRDHIEVDMETLKSIINWLDKNLTSPPPPPPPPLPEAPETEEIVQEEEKVDFLPIESGKDTKSE